MSDAASSSGREVSGEGPMISRPDSPAATCCVEGCSDSGTHLRGFYIRGVDPSVYGEVEVEAAFCCKHIDMLDSDITPLVDLAVSGSERA